jgi:hypothetical protein
MAQLVARLVRIEKVRGSNPLSSTGKDQVTVLKIARHQARYQQRTQRHIPVMVLRPENNSS